MEKYIEMTAKTEEEAIAKGLAQLGLTRDEVSVEILERGKTGFLGIGSVPARVKLTYEGPDAPEETLEAAPRSQTAPKEGEEKAMPVSGGAVKPLRAGEDDVADAIVKFQTGLFAQMGVEAVPTVNRNGDIYQVVLEGQNMGALIGHRGETLDAIQHLTGYTVNRGRSQRVRIHLDAEGYRARRAEALERLAMKTADKVVRYRRNITLDSMNAYERHVIHAALQGCSGVNTYSTGTDPNRRIVVAYAPDKQ